MVEIKPSPGFDESAMAGLHWKRLLIPTRIPPHRDSPPLDVVETQDRVELRLRAGRRYMLPGLLIFLFILAAFGSVFVVIFLNQGKRDLAVGASIVGVCFGAIMCIVMVLLAPRARTADVVWSSTKAPDSTFSALGEVQATAGRVCGVRLVDCSIRYGNQESRFRQLQVRVVSDGQPEWKLAAQSRWGLVGPGRAFASACRVGFEHLTVEGTQNVTPELWRAFCDERLAATPQSPPSPA